MKKILFLIHDLGHGGAEKVLVNLVNHMDKTRFDITVMTLIDVGINKQFLSPDVKYKTCIKKSFPGNSHVMKLLSPEQLHKLFIKEKYDIEVSYLEGPSARIISGCPDKDTKIVSWIHIEQHTKKRLAQSFRSFKEAKQCYNAFHQIICVSDYVRNDFSNILHYEKPCDVLYNTVESDVIKKQSTESVDIVIDKNEINMVAVGKLIPGKGYDRLLNIVKRLVCEKYSVHLYILGAGSSEQTLKTYVINNNLQDNITFLGYDTNPYKYVSKCDLFVCASFAEGFSTAATEALIVGTPVCTVEVSGMKEMLGDNDEFGVVTENNEQALYEGIKKLLDNPELLKYYKKKAAERGKFFSTEKTVQAVEDMLMNL